MAPQFCDESSLQVKNGTVARQSSRPLRGQTTVGENTTRGGLLVRPVHCSVSFQVVTKFAGIGTAPAQPPLESTSDAALDDCATVTDSTSLPPPPPPPQANRVGNASVIKKLNA